MTEVILKCLAGTVISLICFLLLQKQGKETALLITVSACCGIFALCLSCFRPVMDLFDTLVTVGDLDGDLLQILLKAVGISLICEITASICTDSGNGALAKTIQISSTICILWISIPLFTSLLDLIRDLLEKL